MHPPLLYMCNCVTQHIVIELLYAPDTVQVKVPDSLKLHCSDEGTGDSLLMVRYE